MVTRWEHGFVPGYRDGYSQACQLLRGQLHLVLGSARRDTSVSARGGAAACIIPGAAIVAAPLDG